MNYLYTLFFIYFMSAQNVEIAPIYTSHHDFFRLNTNLTKQMGQGYTGFADSRLFSNMSFNPAIFYNSNQIEFQYNIANKSESGLINGTNFTSKSPNSRFDLFYPISEQLKAHASFDKTRSSFWDNYEYFSFDEDSNLIVEKNNFIEQNVYESEINFAYKIDDYQSFGIGFTLINANLREKSGFFGTYDKELTENSFTLGYLYKKDELAIGITYQTGYTLSYTDSAKLNGRIIYYSWLNDVPEDLSIGLSYQFDKESYFNADLIAHRNKQRGSFYKEFTFDYRVGFRLNYSEDIQVSLGSFSISDSHNKDVDNFLEDDGLYTQRFLTAGVSYFLADFDISASYATSDIVSSKVSAHSRYGMAIIYRL